MTPREFRQEKEFEFDHFIELTSTGIKPNYVNIELFAQEYHKAKLNLLTIPVVVRQSEQLCQHKYQDIRYGTSRCVICGEEEQSF
jgi:hypothetical protein